MAYNVFRIAASGGSNANSGTSSSVIYTTSGATWDGTSQITGITGAGSVTVGDWVNINSAYIAQVTVASATALTLSTTAKYGTAPSAGSYTITDGGYFASVAIFGAVFTTTVPASTEFQWQAGNSSYTLSGNLTIGVAGTTTFPVWHRGFNTTPGDLDNGSTTLAYPTITAGANTVGFAGSTDTLVSGIAITANRAGPAVATTALNLSFRHCQFSNTDANAASFAVTLNTSAVEFTKCYFTSKSTATEIVSSASQSACFNGCWFGGAASGTTQVGILAVGGTLLVNGCTFYKCGSSAIKTTGLANLFIIGNTFYKSGSDHITMTATIQSSNVPNTIANNLFVDAGTNGSGYDINNSSGTNTNLAHVLNNSWYNPASGHTNGLGDTVFDNELAESSLPVTSDSNLTLLSGALGAGGGLPQQWEAQTAGLGGFPDIGAWQRQVTSGGVAGPTAMLTGGRM